MTGINAPNTQQIQWHFPISNFSLVIKVSMNKSSARLRVHSSVGGVMIGELSMAVVATPEETRLL